jgi:outer membrane lipoprotein SlyB
MKRVLIGLLVIGLFLAGCAPVSAPYEADVYTNPRVVEGEYMVRFGGIQPLSIEELRKVNLEQGFPANTSPIWNHGGGLTIDIITLATWIIKESSSPRG